MGRRNCLRLCCCSLVCGSLSPMGFNSMLGRALSADRVSKRIWFDRVKFSCKWNCIVEKSWTRSTLCCPCLTPICLARKDDQPLAAVNRWSWFDQKLLAHICRFPKVSNPRWPDIFWQIVKTDFQILVWIRTPYCSPVRFWVSWHPPATPSRTGRKWRTRSGNSRGTTEVCTTSKHLIWDTGVQVWRNVCPPWSSLCVGICKWAWHVTGAQ